MATTPLPINQAIPTNHEFFPDFFRYTTDGVERLWTLPDLTQTPWLREDLTANAGGLPLLADFNLATGKSFGSVSADSLTQHTVIAEIWWNFARADGSLGPAPGFHHIVTAVSLNVAGVMAVGSSTSLPMDSLTWQLYSTLGDSDLTLMDSGSLLLDQSLLQPEALTILNHTDAGVLIRITAVFTIPDSGFPHGDKEFLALLVREASLTLTEDVPDVVCAPPSKPSLTFSATCNDQAAQTVTALLSWPAVSGDSPITYTLRRRIGTGTDTELGTFSEGTHETTDDTLASGVTYLYSLLASNACGDTLSDFFPVMGTCPPVDGGGGTPPPEEGPWLECAIDQGPGLWTVLTPEGGIAV